MDKTESESAGPSDGNVFRIALSMSGAISAGAYTAGVFDFLVQALAELEAAQDRGDPDAPTTHRVRIVAMTGASAGGVTAALGAVALGYGLRFEADPQPAEPWARKPTSVATKSWGSIDSVLPGLYDAWVIKPRMTSDSGRPGDPWLLSTSDIGSGKLASLLNCDALDKIRRDALTNSIGSTASQQGKQSRQDPEYAFLADPLHLYMTVSNLPGVQYEIRGATSSDVYRMVSHGDRLHFVVAGLGKDTTVSSTWGRDDTGTALAVADLTAPGGPSEGWQLLGDGALATAAFPGGLTARVLHATRDEYGTSPPGKPRLFPAPEFSGTRIAPDWPDTVPKSPATFDYVSVDGGMINNDPFEIARYCLLEDWKEFGAFKLRAPGDANARAGTSQEGGPAFNLRAPGDADRAVIMIAPFPEGAKAGDLPDSDKGLVRVVKSLLPTLIQQARFKIGDLAAAADKNYASRWLIAPRRTAPAGPAAPPRAEDNDPPSSDNIACALLGGFGGFLDQSFREHDFQLGRRNCQKFLDGWTESKFTYADAKQVIPRLGSAKPDVAFPDWPRMSQDDFGKLMDRIGWRADAVVPALLQQEVGSALLRWGGSAAWSADLKPKLLKAVRLLILQDLFRRDQIEGGLSGSESNWVGTVSAAECKLIARKVIAALADPQFDLRTAHGISIGTKTEVNDVQNIIDKGVKLPDGDLFKVWESFRTAPSGRPAYTLFCRRPGWGARSWTSVAAPIFGSDSRLMPDVTIDDGPGQVASA